MKNYKLLITAITLLLLIVFIGVFLWLWINNGKNTDPLPIMVGDNTTTQHADNEESLINSTLYVQADETLQVALDDVIIKFESRFPRVQVLAHYVPAKALLNLPTSQSTAQNTNQNMTQATTDNANQNNATTNIDIIIADGKLSQERLAPLQAMLDNNKNAHHQSPANHDKAQLDSEQKTDTHVNNQLNNNANANDNASDNVNDNINKNPETRQLTSFSYAIKAAQTVDGVIITDNAIAATFRNFILSSAGQDILQKYDYETIDGYKNTMDDLFNPSSRGKSAATEEDTINIADALGE